VLAWLWRRRTRPNETPRRLVYCLPTRVLVEQTRDRIQEWVSKLGKQDELGVHSLMGGEVQEEWERSPETEEIIVGTQDMLLSRSLNRGYAETRFRWPVSFGLLNSDCLWVSDEVQLMSTGLTTSAQLAAFRRRFSPFGPAHYLWMSATLDRRCLGTVDFGEFADALQEEKLLGDDRAVKLLARRLTAPKQLERCEIATDASDYPGRAAGALSEVHRDGTLTMAIVNTVERAQDIWEAVKRSHSDGNVLLIHSRFRAQERAVLHEKLKQTQDSGGIVIATQVVEAGVDI